MTTDHRSADDTSPVQAVRSAAERTKTEMVAAKEKLSEAVDERRGGPATSVDDALDKTAALREALERDVAALRVRVPEPAAMTERVRTVGIAAAGGMAILTLGGVLLSRRSNRRTQQRAVHEQAAAIARELARLGAEDLAPDDPGDAAGGGHWVGRAALAAAGVAAGAAAWMRLQTPPDELDLRDESP